MTATTPPNHVEDEEIADFVHRWAEAIASNDVEQMSPFTTDDWILIDKPGVTTREAFHGVVASGMLRHDSMTPGCLASLTRSLSGRVPRRTSTSTMPNGRRIPSSSGRHWPKPAEPLTWVGTRRASSHDPDDASSATRSRPLDPPWIRRHRVDRVGAEHDLQRVDVVALECVNVPLEQETLRLVCLHPADRWGREGSWRVLPGRAAVRC